jgi:hypothetical protein
MMNLWRLSLLAATVLLLVGPGVAAAAPALTPAPTPSVPLELQPWIDWVKGVELPPGECRQVDETMVCVWPTRLALNVSKSGGTFELEVTAHDAESVLCGRGSDHGGAGDWERLWRYADRERQGRSNLVLFLGPCLGRPRGCPEPSYSWDCAGRARGVPTAAAVLQGMP